MKTILLICCVTLWHLSSLPVFVNAAKGMTTSTRTQKTKTLTSVVTGGSKDEGDHEQTVRKDMGGGGSRRRRSRRGGGGKKGKKRDDDDDYRDKEEKPNVIYITSTIAGIFFVCFTALVLWHMKETHKLCFKTKKVYTRTVINCHQVNLHSNTDNMVSVNESFTNNSYENGRDTFSIVEVTSGETTSKICDVDSTKPLAICYVNAVELTAENNNFDHSDMNGEINFIETKIENKDNFSLKENPTKDHVRLQENPIIDHASLEKSESKDKVSLEENLSKDSFEKNVTTDSSETKGKCSERITEINSTTEIVIENDNSFEDNQTSTHTIVADEEITNSTMLEDIE